MSSLNALHEAFGTLTESWSEGRIAHGYLVAGTPRGEGGLFAKSMIQWLFCQSETGKPCGLCRGCRLVDEKTHPDVFWIEPESKSRIIQASQVRELIQSLGHTSYEGGWKVAVVLEADRMMEAASNIFLKTLEEPPPHSMVILVTESPQALLPTIVSRCQRVTVSETAEGSDRPEWWEDLIALLRSPAATPAARIQRSGAFKALLDRVREQETDAEKGADEEEDVDKKVREARIQARVLRSRTLMLKAVQAWYRDVAACAAGADKKVLHFPAEADTLRVRAESVGLDRAVRHVREVETMSRSLERAMVELSVFEVCLPG